MDEVERVEVVGQAAARWWYLGEAKRTAILVKALEILDWTDEYGDDNAPGTLGTTDERVRAFNVAGLHVTYSPPRRTLYIMKIVRSRSAG